LLLEKVATFFINFKQRKWLVLRSFFKEIGEAYSLFFTRNLKTHKRTAFPLVQATRRKPEACPAPFGIRKLFLILFVF
jgi:hypothetical protein